MSRDKQIEEIVKDFCPLYQEYGSCKQCNKDLDIDDEPCYYGCVANLIIDYGYRKSSDVAEEIFAEIEKWLANDGDIRLITAEKLAELKKKYTESEDTE
jgi:hypothetical protein